MIITSKDSILNYKELKNKKRQAMKSIKEFEKEDVTWNYEKIRENVEISFNLVQKAWMERDQEIVRDYMSNGLYRKHKTQTDWMAIRKEVNVLVGMTLVNQMPIGAVYSTEESKNVLWVKVRGAGKDYIINEETNEIISGDRNHVEVFQEYWKYIKFDGRWVLDEIRQVDEIDVSRIFSGRI